MSGTLAPAVLVLGASGTVGSGVVAALLEAGSPVLAVARDAGRLERMASRFGDAPGLTLLPASVADDAQAARLGQALRSSQQPLRAVIACLAGPLARGRLLDRPASGLLHKLDTDVLTHLAAARQLVPLLAASTTATETNPARYLVIGATGAECGWSGYGEASIAAAAQAMLVKVLHQEAAPLGVRVQMLSLDHPVCTPERDDARWPDALSVGRRAVSMLCREERPVRSVVRYADAWTPAPACSALRAVPAALSSTPPPPH